MERFQTQVLTLSDNPTSTATAHVKLIDAVFPDNDIDKTHECSWWEEHDANLCFGELGRQKVSLCTTDDGHLQLRSYLAFHFLLELYKSGNDVRAVHLDDKWYLSLWIGVRKTDA